MKRYFFICMMLGGTIMLLSFGQRDIRSNGAPIGSTGAPNDHTCAKSGCHADNAINSGSGDLQLSFGNGETQYQTGSSYPITVTVSQPGIERFGFQVVAVNSNGISIGTLVVTDSTRTQTIAGINQFAGKDYMTYKYLGTDPFSTGVGKWTFNWKAPDTDEGPVTFYVAAAAANNDGTDLGDLIYTESVTVNDKTTGIETAANIRGNLSIYPNPLHGPLTVHYTVSEASKTIITLIDATSGKLFVIDERSDAIGDQIALIDIDKSFAAGIYILSVKSGADTFMSKLMIP